MTWVLSEGWNIVNMDMFCRIIPFVINISAFLILFLSAIDDFKYVQTYCNCTLQQFQEKS